VGEVAANLTRVRRRVAEAALRSGRRAEDIRLVAVSKTVPLERVREAYAAGQRDFGENRVQEALQKIDAGTDMSIRWHLIGHLQSNKARKAAAQVDYIHAIDSVDLLRRVDQAAVEAGRTVQVLVQVDLALEPTKHGTPVEVVPEVLKAAAGLQGARLCGLMLLPPLAENPEEARPWFRSLRQLRDRWVEAGTPPESLRELSMGMSHDFEVAIEEGATIVRVGSAIFGARSDAPQGQRKVSTAMKVTPLDLRQQRFNTVMRGFDRGEVTAFLNEVADDYENALREADRLRQEVVKLEAVLAEHRGQERNLRNTLLTAQKMADEIKDQANTEAQRVLKEADSRADLIVQKSQARVEDVQREIEGLRAKRREVESGVEALVGSLQSTLAFIREQDARARDERVLLLHRPKQNEPPAAAQGTAQPQAAQPNERASQG